MHGHSSRRRLPATAGKLALALGVCLCAGQLMAGPAAAAPAALVAAETTAVAQAAAAVAPKVALTTSTRRLPWGSSVKLTARVTDASTGEAVGGGSVQFQALRAGKWVSVGTRPVYSNGGTSQFSKPFVATTFRAVFTGLSPSYTSAATGSIKVAVVASRAKVVYEARKLIGKPYRYGAAGPSAFDCSGYTKYVYRKAIGAVLPHKANSQQRYGKAIAKSQAQPGDLIVIRSGSYGYHVGIYAGGGYMYDSPKPGSKVGKHKIWTSSYVVRRLV